MALTKTAAKASNQDVVQLIAPEAAEDVQMGISAEGMALILDRLTDLYTNPVDASAREVISNAVDATVLLPVEERKPVEVVLPSSLRAAFVVRDYGVGMSLATVKNIYSKYGASTKSNDFRQVGAYGLGAKAPLAYCTEFSVSTTHEGITTSFQVSRTAEGNFVKIISSEETGRESGTVVTIPARMEDLNSFRTSLETYRQYSFDVPIKIDGAIAVPSSDWLVLEDEFVLDADSGTTGRMWVKKEKLGELFLHRFADYGDFAFGYVLSGYHYAAPTSNNSYYYRREPSVIVELLPGVVDFSSSRDAITKNERSQALNKRVTDYLSSMERGPQESILAHYRTMELEDAEKFFMQLFHRGKLTDNSLVFEHRGSRGTCELSVEDLRLAGGVSPLAIYLEDYKKNAYGAFVLKRVQGRGGVYFYDPRLMAQPDLFSYTRSPWTTATVSEANAATREALKGAASFSLASLGLQMAVLRNNHDATERMIVIEKPEEKELARLQAMRRLLSINGYHNTTFVFVSKASSVKQQLKIIQENTTLTVETKTIDELLSEGKTLRKAERAARPAPVEEAMGLRVLTDTGLSNETEVLDTLRSRHMGYVTMTPTELKKQKAVLVISKSDHASALIGAANNGMKITNRPIYMVNGPRALKAAHYKALKNYSAVAVSSDFSYPCKDATALKERATFHGRLLHSQLAAATLEDIVRSVIVPLYIPKQFFLSLAAYARSNSTLPDSMLSLAELAANVERYAGSRFGVLSDEELLAANDTVEARAVVAFRSAIYEIRREESLESALFIKFMERSKEENNEWSKALFDHFAKILVNHSV